MEARDLKKGDVLWSKGDGELIITSLSSVDESTKVYHLEVEGYHNFGVHQGGILVHNKSSGHSEAAGSSLARFTIVNDYFIK